MEGRNIARHERSNYSMSKMCLHPTVASLLFLTSTAFADDFVFPSAGGVVWDNVYVNPYTAQDNTVSPTTPLTIFCDDWNTEFYAPATWEATVYSLASAVADPTTLAKLKYGNTPQSYTVGWDTSGFAPVLTLSPKLILSAQVATSILKRPIWIRKLQEIIVVSAGGISRGRVDSVRQCR